MQQIAVGAVDFNCIDAHGVRTLGRQHKSIAHAVHSRAVHFRGRRLLRQLGQWRGAHGTPAALSIGQQLPARPRYGARCFAPGMGQLDTHRHLGRQFAGAVQMAAQSAFRGRVPQTQAGRGNAAFGHHGRGLDGEHTGTTIEQIAPMHQMPVIRLALGSSVLAHGRDHDAVGQYQLGIRAAQGVGGKQGTHGMRRKWVRAHCAMVCQKGAWAWASSAGHQCACNRGRCGTSAAQLPSLVATRRGAAFNARDKRASIWRYIWPSERKGARCTLAVAPNL